MKDIGSLIWLIFIVLWIVSALAKAKKLVKVERKEDKGEFPPLPEIKPLAEREEYEEEVPPTPEETLEGFLRRLAGGEEKRKAPPPPEIKPVVEPVEVPPALKVEEPPPRRVRIPPAEEEEEIREPILESADLETLRQGIILAEILGPPRAGRPL